MRDSFDRYRQKYPNGDKSNNTWGSRLEMLAGTIPDRIAFIQGDKELTWEQFNERVNKLANAFLDLELKKEDRIAIMGFNCIEWMESYFAASRMGAVPVNVNARFVLHEIKYVLENSDSVALVLEREAVEAVKQARKELPLLKHCIVWGEAQGDMLSYDELMEKYPDTKPRLDWNVTNEDFCFLFYTGGTTGYPKGTVWDYENRDGGLDMIMYNAIIPLIDNLGKMPREAFLGTVNSFFPPEAAEFMQPIMQMQIAPEQLIEIIKAVFPPEFDFEATKTAQSIVQSLQSAPEAAREKLARFIGASSEERGAMQKIFLDQAVISLMKDQVLHLLGNPLSYFQTGSRVRLLVAAPLFHGAAYEANFSHIGSSGATSIYLTSRRFDPRELWETVERIGANYILIVGDAFAIPMVEELEKRKYDLSPVRGIISSGVIWSPKVKRKLLEFMPDSLMLDELGTTESSAAHTHFSSSTDPDIPMLKTKVSLDGPFPCRVINPETGKDVRPGEKGEFVYGGYMALGYWKDPEKTARSWKLIDGERWFFVGDEGTVDEEGYFHFIGRGPTVINTGGEKVYPEEVEETIKTHPKIRDTAVIGVPDERWGEAVTAIVELKAGERAGPEEIIDFCRGRLAGYKKPKHVIFVEEIPRAAAGKIDRTHLKEMAKKMLGIR